MHVQKINLTHKSGDLYEIEVIIGGFTFVVEAYLDKTNFDIGDGKLLLNFNFNSIQLPDPKSN